MSRNVSSWQKLLANQIANNDLVPIVDMSAAGRDRNKVAQIDQIVAKILAGLPRASEIDSLFAAAPVGAVVRKKADGMGLEYATLPKLLGVINTAASITGTTTETLFPESVLVPANTLKAGSILVVTALYSSTSNANVKTFNIKIAGNSILNYVSSGTFQSLQIQRFCFCRNSDVVSFSSASANSYAAISNAVTSFALNYAIDNTITFSGQLANGSDTMTLQGASVRAL